MFSRSILYVSLIGLMMACQSGRSNADVQKEIAVQYLRDVYGGNIDALDEIVSDDVVSTYPIFEENLGSVAIRGKEALKEFSTGFSQRWTDQELTVHESIAEGNDVVMIWSFKAVWAASGQETRWGGISMVRFDDSGKIKLEVGEESTPGPSGRLRPDEL